MFLNKCYFYCTLSRQAEVLNYPKYCLSEIGPAPFISDNRGSTVYSSAVCDKIVSVKNECLGDKGVGCRSMTYVVSAACCVAFHNVSLMVCSIYYGVYLSVRDIPIFLIYM